MNVACRQDLFEYQHYYSQFNGTLLSNRNDYPNPIHFYLVNIVMFDIIEKKIKILFFVDVFFFFILYLIFQRMYAYSFEYAIIFKLGLFEHEHTEKNVGILSFDLSQLPTNSFLFESIKG